jgi:hypothetical protein
MISRLYTVLDELVEGTSHSSPKLAYKDGLEKLEKYFPRRANLSDRAIQAHVIATILDPRFKLYVRDSLRYKVKTQWWVQQRHESWRVYALALQSRMIYAHGSHPWRSLGTPVTLYVLRGPN